MEQTYLKIGKIIAAIYAVVLIYLFATAKEMAILLPIAMLIIGIPVFVSYFAIVKAYYKSGKTFLITLVVLFLLLLGYTTIFNII